MSKNAFLTQRYAEVGAEVRRDFNRFGRSL